jgi:hypothetical protein
VSGDQLIYTSRQLYVVGVIESEVMSIPAAIVKMQEESLWSSFVVEARIVLFAV